MNDAQEILYSQAVKILVNFGFDLSDIFRQRKVKEEEAESRVLTPEDFLFSVTTPESWSSHFEKEMVGDVFVGGVKELSLSTIRLGGQFTLAPSWRAVLRERCGMTPTATITVSLLDFFKDTKVISRLRIESNMHIADQKNRKHILQSYVITDFTSFMKSVKLVEEMTAEADKVSDEVKGRSKKEKTTSTTPKLNAATIAADYLF